MPGGGFVVGRHLHGWHQIPQPLSGLGSQVRLSPAARPRRLSWNQALSMYLPVRVSTLIFSPVLIKSGAWTVMPVSSVICFWTLLAESPRTPSGASDTFKITLEGSSIETALSSTKVTVTDAFSTR